MIKGEGNLSVRHPDLREAGSKSRHVLLERLDRRRVLALRDLLAEVLELAALGLDVERDLHAAVEEVDDRLEVGLVEASARERRRAHAHAARRQGRLVARDRVLVQGDVRLLEDGFDARAVDLLAVLQVYQY